MNFSEGLLRNTSTEMPLPMPGFLFESVTADDLGLVNDHRLSTIQPMIAGFGFHSSSSNTVSSSCHLFSMENKPVAATLCSQEVHLSHVLTKQPKIESIYDPYPNSLPYPPPDPKMISFMGEPLVDNHGMDSINLKPKVGDLCNGGAGFSPFYHPSKKRTFGGMSPTPLNAPKHVLAERKRREKLTQLFIALSAMIPGLNKLDKASVLEDAIKYMKDLQENVKLLEEDIAMKSMVFGKRYGAQGKDDDPNSQIPSSGRFDGELPEVAARVSDKHILLRIHCEKRQGSIANIFKELEKLSLTVISHSILPFGHSILDVTVVAKMDAAFSETMEDLVRSLRQGLVDYL